MKRLISFVICIVALSMIIPQEANAQKKKKEKKPFVWVLPELTGNDSFDEYLLKCDTLNTRIHQYCDNITFYEVAEIHVIDENGEKEINYHVVDSLGNLRSSNKAFIQNLNLILAYPSLASEMALMAACTASATTALPSLGLKAMSYGKYLKAGPKIIEKGGVEMKKIYKKARTQAKQIKALKAGKIDDVKALNAEINTSDMEAGTATMRVIEMQKTDYEAEFSKITKEDEENPVTQDDIPEEEV